MQNEMRNISFDWNVYNFSAVSNKFSVESEEFSLLGHKWILEIFPKGDNKSQHGPVKIFLIYMAMDNAPKSLELETFVRIGILDRFGYKRTIFEGPNCFQKGGAWGGETNMAFEDLDDIVIDDILVITLCFPDGLPKLSFPRPENCLAAQWKNPTYTDIKVRVEDRVFPAHRMVLSRCPFFENMFSNECAENKEHIVELKETPKETFEFVLEYLYTDCSEIPVECDVFNLYAAARFLLMADLQKLCEREIRCRLSTDNVAKALKFAYVYSVPNLKKRCIEMATSSTSATASIMLTPDYIELIQKQNPDLHKEFLEDCVQKGKKKRKKVFVEENVSEPGTPPSP